MLIRSMTLSLALAGGAVPAALPAQQGKHDRAKAFALDGIDTPAAQTATAAPAPEPTATASATPAASGLRASFTLDTPIADLIADPAAKAVLDKDLPGLSSDKNLDKFAKLGLRQFQPLTGGQLTDALLVQVARDLAGLSGPMLAPIAPVAGGGSRRNHDASR
jgi:hypothetical protein